MQAVHAHLGSRFSCGDGLWECTPPPCCPACWPPAAMAAGGHTPPAAALSVSTTRTRDTRQSQAPDRPGEATTCALTAPPPPRPPPLAGASRPWTSRRCSVTCPSRSWPAAARPGRPSCSAWSSVRLWSAARTAHPGVWDGVSPARWHHLSLQRRQALTPAARGLTDALCVTCPLCVCPCHCSRRAGQPLRCPLRPAQGAAVRRRCVLPPFPGRCTPYYPLAALRV